MLWIVTHRNSPGAERLPGVSHSGEPPFPGPGRHSPDATQKAIVALRSALIERPGSSQGQRRMFGKRLTRIGIALLIANEIRGLIVAAIAAHAMGWI